MKLSRRQLAASLTTAAAAAALPQTADPQQPPLDAEQQAARAALQASIQTVRSLPLPMTVEPAARFEAKG